MDLFKCPVCQKGSVVGEEKDKKVSCNTCGTIFLSDKSYGTYFLRKLLTAEYTDRYKELKSRQNDIMGLSSEDWNSIANGGNTKREQELINQEEKAAEHQKREAN